MIIARRSLEGLIAIAVAVLTATSLVGCASLIPASRADCNVVRLQREAGRSDAQIASALGVSESDVGQCSGGTTETFSGGGTGGAEEMSGAESSPPPAGGESSSSGESSSGSQSGSTY